MTKKTEQGNATPLMKQYNAFKAKYPSALLLFRVGDFYETFGEDAIKASKILGIVLTKRANGSGTYIELAGFPHHSIDTYLPKLVRAGEKVAVCDQLEDPKLTNKIVKRGVTELVTPGVAYNDKVLENRENNFLAAVHLDGRKGGVSFLDVSTGEFLTAQGSSEYLDKLLSGLNPKEIIIQRDKRDSFTNLFGSNYFLTTFDDWVFTIDFTYEILIRHFQTTSLKGFGIDEMQDSIIASGAVLHYLKETHHDKTSHISKISRIEEDKYVWLDQFTIRNLELLNSPNQNAATLIDVLDDTKSPMGARLLKRWMVLPLKEKSRIEDRLDAVGYFKKESKSREALQDIFKGIGDVERLISKVSIAKINPRELQHISKSLKQIPKVIKLCISSDLKPLKLISSKLNACKPLSDEIDKTLISEPSVQLNKGGVVATGISEELDELRKIAYSGKDYLREIVKREIQNTGIPSLKIGYNNVFGYYLEVTKLHNHKVPETWIRKQTLANYERYITEELKEYESKILGAEEKIISLEAKIFNDLVITASEFIEPVQLNAALIAQLDVLVAFAKIAEINNYVRPEINEGFALDIKSGRHPVIELHMPHDEEYIANDVFLDIDKQQIIILTGPNMSGKSALLRQTALIVIMAQIGCFVPAQSASIGLTDKIFTRVGASDNISSGESTFMVEMNETASILNNVSNRSLIILDEIGRGTSTYDGISIAWAIVDFLHSHPAFRAKVLFATHYHELNEMANSLSRVKNFHILVKEIANKIIFMRKLVEGGSEHSFGIHVARMAGMPKSVLFKSEEMLKKLENSHSNNNLGNAVKMASEQKALEDSYQLSFIQLDDPLLLQIKEDILNIDINTLTPVEALMKLNKIKNVLAKKS
ncbi:MAG: DNA mismatch repair protein MutS [Bacteroidetes bacterium CG2_30_33_31]|nr:MAG: DNA mismatch repair protein MutS [Bacteroidetes bacterium CG2_30_33_31]